MNTMHKMLITVLGVLLGTLILASPAMANHQANALVDRANSDFYAPGYVSVYDASYNPDSEELTIEWDCDGELNYVPFDVDATGPEATCQYPEEGQYRIVQRVTAHGEARYASISDRMMPAQDAPNGFKLLSGPSLALPGEVVVETAKPNASADCSTGSNFFDQCEARRIDTVGPSAAGKYQHTFRIPVASDMFRLEFETSNAGTGDEYSDPYEFRATSNAYDPFHLVSAEWELEAAGNKCDIQRVVSYYAPHSTTAQIVLKAKFRKKRKQSFKRKKVKDTLSEAEPSYFTHELDSGGKGIKLPQKFFQRKLKNQVKAVQTIKVSGQTVQSEKVKLRLTKNVLKSC